MKLINRRRFILNGSAGVLSLPWLNRLFGKENIRTADRSQVVVIRDAQVLNQQNVIQADRVQDMTDAGIRTLTGIGDVGDAWKSLFPGISDHSVISIKVNCLFPLSSHPEVAYAVANGLQRMQVNGNPFPANQIIIWDRTDSDLTGNGGYTINTGSEGVRVAGTSHSGFGYDTQLSNIGGSTQNISRILTDHSDYLINLCVMKDHGIADVTFSMKNHYGTCSHPGGLHGNRCNPYIPALNRIASISDKQVLCICDALFAIRSGGPGGYPQVAPKRLIFSLDPVAHDTICLNILNTYRNTAIPMPEHIATAASDAYQLGTNDLNRIDRVDVDLNAASTVRKTAETASDFQLFRNYPNPFNTQTLLSYRIHKSGSVIMDICNVRGRQVRKLFDGLKSPGFYQIPWDGRDQDHQDLPSGLYLARLRTRSHTQTIRMQLLK